MTLPVRTGTGPARRSSGPRPRRSSGADGRAAAGTGLPWPLGVLAGLGLLVLVLPLLALVVRAPWRRLPALVADPASTQALTLSVGTAAVSTLVCLLLGVPLAWVLARSDVPGRPLLRALVTVPLVLPPVVGGVGLLLLLGRRGLLGQYLDLWFGVRLPFTTSAVVLAQVFVSLPFLVVAVEGALRGADRRYEAVAATLGASRWRVLTHVTLPLVAPGVVAGAVLCFARALGEFGATVTFAGSFPGVTRTVPLSVYVLLETDPDAAVALSLVLLAVSVAVLVGLRDRWVGALR